MSHTTTKFWSVEFSIMCVINLSVMTAMFMLFPYQMQLLDHFGMTNMESSLCICLFAIGMFLPGPFNSYLVDAYRRKSVCQYSLLVLMLSCVVMEFVPYEAANIVLRIIQGMCFGTFQMSLGGTLVNDMTLSEYRTAADYFYTWFGLMGMPLGSVLGVYLLEAWGTYVLFCSIIVLLAASLVLLMFLHIPFRAPVKASLFSLDRFFFPKAFFLVVNLLPMAVLPTLFVASAASMSNLLMMCAGVAGGFLSHRLFFVDADPRADAVSGLIMVLASVAMMLNPGGQDFMNAAYLFLGIGGSWFFSRILLYFLKLSDHCQRGTLQQTYILTLITGNCLGFYLAHLPLNVCLLTMILTVFSLAFFVLVTHRWFIHKKGRDFKFREV